MFKINDLKSGDKVKITIPFENKNYIYIGRVLDIWVINDTICAISVVCEDGTFLGTIISVYRVEKLDE
jgi:hypothetical protein